MIALEAALALAAATLLAVAALLLGPWRPRGVRVPVLLAAGLELGAIGLLAAACVSEAVAQGGWSPSDVRQVALSLACAVTVTGLAGRWALRDRSAGLGVHLVALALAVGALGFWPAAAPCAWRTPGYWIPWALSVAGVGAAAAAGGAGLDLALRAVASRSGRRELEPAEPLLLQWATRAALVILGAGLLAGAAWALRAYGSLAVGDPRRGWLAAVWALAAAGLLAGRLPKAAGPTNAVLAILAATGGIAGLLAGPDLLRLLGM